MSSPLATFAPCGLYTTRAAVQRAETITVGALGDETFAHLRREGALPRSEDVDAIAFAAEDIS